MFNLNRLRELLRQLWVIDLRTIHGLHRIQVLSLRITYAVIRDLAAGQLNMRAMSLVYTTLLSLIPVLAISFSVLKAFGVNYKDKPLIYNLLLPLGERGIEIGNKIMGFVENIQVGVLGSIGLALLFYMVISLLQKVERSFNYVWRIDRPRHFARRFSDYLSVILVGPVLVFTAIAITASLKTAVLIQAGDVVILSDSVNLIGKLVPYFLIIAAFTFVYVFMPNTKVRLMPALIGAIVAGLLWQSLGWLFASFVVSSTNYDAIYSRLAILIVFMIWIYLGWVILLVGVDVSFYIQNPLDMLSPETPARLNRNDERQFALAIMIICGRAFHEGNKPPDIIVLSDTLGIAPNLVDETVQELIDAKLLSETTGEDEGLLPSRDMQNITIVDILSALDGRKTLSLPCSDETNASLEIMHKLAGAQNQALDGLTLQQLVMRIDEKENS
jgi:membrane protein